MTTIKTLILKKKRIVVCKKKRNTFVVAGGVAANKKIRKVLTDLSIKENLQDDTAYEIVNGLLNFRYYI